MRSFDSRLDREASDQTGFRMTTILFDPTIYARRYRLIGAAVLVAVLIGALVGLFRPHTYTAKVVLLIGSKLGQSGSIVAEGERRAYGIKSQQLLARKARLQAEIAGQKEIAFPAELVRSSDEVVETLVDGERQLFAARRRSIEESVDRFRQEKTLADQRVATLAQQAQLVGVQQKSIDQELAALKSLVDRKLVPTPRLGDMQRTAAIIASRRVEIDSEVVRTQQGKNQADQRMTEFLNQRRSEVLAEMQLTEAELREYGTRRETLQAVATSAVVDQKFDPGMLANQAEIITSDGLVRRVVQRLKLDEDPGFAKSAGAGPDGRLASAVAVLQANLLAVRVGPGSRMDVSVRARNAGQAAGIANAVADVYVQSQTGSVLRGIDDRLLIAADPQQPGATVLRAAEVPPRADGPGLASICAAALVLGLVVGIGMAAAVEVLAAFAKARDGQARAAAAARSTVPLGADRVLPVRRTV